MPTATGRDTVSLHETQSVREKSVGGGAVAEWVRALACTGDRAVRDGFESHCGQLRFGTGNSVYPALIPVSFGDTKSRRPLLSGVYARSRPGEVKDHTSPHWNF